jgi:hypothetical protein
MKGITGVVFIELGGGDPAAQTLLAATAPDKIPEIPSEKAGLKAMLDDLPKIAAKFSAMAEKFSGMAEKISGMAGKFSGIGDEVKKVVTDVGGLTDKVKANPSLLLRRPEKERK